MRRFRVLELTTPTGSFGSGPATTCIKSSRSHDFVTYGRRRIHTATRVAWSQRQSGRAADVLTAPRFLRVSSSAIGDGQQGTEINIVERPLTDSATPYSRT